MPIPNKTRVSLTALSRELTAITGEPAPSYRFLWNKVVSGELPPVEKVNGQYGTDRSNLPAIAAFLGMTTPTQPAAEEQETGSTPAGGTSAPIVSAQLEARQSSSRGAKGATQGNCTLRRIRAIRSTTRREAGLV